MTLLLIAVAALLLLIAGAPFIPSHNRDIAKVFDKLNPADGRTFVDLGSGDGRVLRYARQYGFKVEGYELNPVLWLWSKIKLGWSTKINLRPWQQAELSHVDLVYIFSTTWHLKNLNRQRFPESATVIIYGPQPDSWKGLESTGVGSAIIYWPVAQAEPNKLT